VTSPDRLVSNADSGHSDQQPSFDSIEQEEDGQDEGVSSPFFFSFAEDTTLNSDYHMRHQAHH
jgi:hypothetical protein